MSLQQTLPWTKKPLIVNGPMGGVANAPLAIAVTSAGALGQIGILSSVDDLRTQLSTAASSLPRTAQGFLPLGIGLLSFAMKAQLHETVAALSESAPQVVWLFGAHDNADYAEWATAVRSACRPGTQVWVQVGSVASAVEIARLARPDALCVQGSDAGGHGLEAGAGVVSLLPEVDDALRAAGHAEVPLLAAGGIVDGRGVAAALALGAQGVVMGTRFLAAREATVHPGYRSAVLATSDGGQRTVRSKVFDEVKGPNKWPSVYDGRSILNVTHQEHLSGVALDKIREEWASAVKSEDAGYSSTHTGRATMWAGTGVGIVKQEQSAAEIVEEVRRDAVTAIENARLRL